MMSMQVSVTYCVIRLHLRNRILQRLTMMLPGQWFIFSHSICFTFLLSVHVRSWLVACTCLSPSSLSSPPQIAFLFGRTRSFLSIRRSFQGGKHGTIPNVACGMCISPQPWRETGQSTASGSFPLLFFPEGLVTTVSVMVNSSGFRCGSCNCKIFPFFPPPTSPPSLSPSFLIGKIGEGDMVRAEILK